MKNKGLKLGLLCALIAVLMSVPVWSTGGKPTAIEDRVKVHMFMGNSGVPHPSGCDPSDNWAINIVEDYANVDLIMEVPAYADFATKMNLLLASGDLPDVVHGWQRNEMEKAADAGAFIDLKSYYDKSSQVKKVIDSIQMELTKTEGGKYWALPMSMKSRDAGCNVIVRHDLLMEYNGGKYPGTVDEWIEFLRWVKKTYPNSVPVSPVSRGHSLFLGGASFFLWHGIATPYNTRIQDGKVVKEFTLPEYKEAVRRYRQLYEEGILDKEFVNNGSPQRAAKLYGNKVTIWSNDIDQILPIAQVYRDKITDDGAYLTFAPPLTQYPAVVKDLKYTYPYDLYPIAGHRLAISSDSENKDAAWRVLEGFSSDELREAQAWGREGIEYTIEGGKRVPTDLLYNNDTENPDSHYWTLVLGIVWGFWPTEVKYALQEKKLGTELWNQLDQSCDWIREARVKRGVRFTSFVKAIPGVSEKQAEADAFISSAIAKAIIGEISMDGFDEEVKQYQRQFGFIEEAVTKWVNEHKKEMQDLNVIEVDW